MDTMSRLYAYYVSLAEQFGNGFISLEELGSYVSDAENHLFHYYMDRLPEREAEEALRSFRRMTAPVTGKGLSLPGDYHERIALTYDPSGSGNLRNVLVVNESRAEALAANSLRSNNVYAIQDATGYSIYPIGSKTVVGLQLRYYARPANIVFGGAKESGVMVINDATTPTVTAGGTPLPASTLPMFAPAYWPVLMHRALELAGVKLSDENLYNAAARMQAEEEAR